MAKSPAVSYTPADLKNPVSLAVRRLQASGRWPGSPATAVAAGTAAGRPLVTAAEVEAAAGPRLLVPPEAVITPEARDRARERGIEIATAPPAAGQAPFGPTEEALAEQLAAYLAEELSGQDADELACWCRSDCLTKCPDRVAVIARAGADRIGIATAAPPLDDAIAPLIDHTMLKPEASEAEVVRLCREAVEYGFAAVVVNPYYVPLASDLVRGSPVRVCTVAGFPLGANMPEVKAYEATRAIRDGAQEIDMVINVGALKSGRDEWVLHDIRQVVEASRPHGAVVKVILETALLTDAEKVRACELARDAGADFVKTSTGFGPGGATADDVALMRRVVGRTMGVKAAGGIGTREQAAELIAAGATRIGASAGVRIARGL